MSRELRTLVESELNQIRLMLESRRGHLTPIVPETASIQAIDALAALLHSAYTAVERILVHIARHEQILEEIQRRPATWHSALLTRLAQPRGARPPLIEETLRDQLAEYMSFRHVFRHAYVHELDWKRLRPLVRNLEPTLVRFEGAIKAYLDQSTTAERVIRFSRDPVSPSRIHAFLCASLCACRP